MITALLSAPEPRSVKLRKINPDFPHFTLKKPHNSVHICIKNRRFYRPEIIIIFKSGNNPERIYIMNTANTHQNEIPTAAPGFLPDRVAERKIGRATFIVSSCFNDGQEKDIISIIARLVQQDNSSYGKPA
jgi:hypothetical protein